jgi:transcription-repair coupling factor (superfamily II helicase)
MDEMLRENEIGAILWFADDPKSRLPAGSNIGRGFREVIITTGLLHSGFILGESQLYILTDREIFGRYKRRHVYRKIYKGLPIADAREIRKGDYVVHIDHGVGRFEGIRTQNVDNKTTDFVELRYADEDVLLVPVEKIAYIQKYSGTESAAPTLDKLGGKRWIQRRKKSQEEIEKLAKELLELYARRAVSRGHDYGDDTLWQREFESSFLYTETPDQLRAIDDVKRDMASPKPMDRLVCGDVGYGKTEVAIRAAFKSILSKKQVALLCPTTILAQQHFNTFMERFADYPVRVEMISRFRTPAEVKKILAELREGNVNMIVGTHALLGKSVQFKDLGLVIVDEEQRFGVAHKERLKELRSNVDFLTLTATPIPRTLYMALSGLRDMSVINTPPADRHPIKTRVIHWDRDQIEEAILRELNRGGQVYFVHNRVQNINQIADKIKEIVPSARIAIGHGQMNEHELEQIMLDFIDQKYDILVSTTIIESGLDIPNVNTIIVNRADTLGLAQLYQIRGRVGRENRRAYAYLIVPGGQAITEQAVSRLAAIEEFTELGMGFNIAMRDMEIRGTGNLLGKEQHGTMNAIGFELYCRMLEDAVETLRGSIHDSEEREVEIQWKISAFLPADYIPVEAQRVMLYKKIAEAGSTADLDEIAAEMRDRFGEVERQVFGADGSVKQVEALPAAVENLISVAKLRILGRRAGLRKIVLTQNGFKLFRPAAVQELGPAVRSAIHNENPKVYTDDPNVLEFHYSDWAKRLQLPQAVQILETAEHAPTG